MFKKILIANRGEIACRVIATARRMGVATVAVYSDADANSRHVAMADEAVRIGPAPARESYLRADRIVAAALATGAEAVHPGYGFLSENEAFAQACQDAGLVFIGPPASAIHAMGSKSEAKALMQAASVPLVPGYHGSAQEPALLQREADAIGYPVLIKASAGGGGKGMRVVNASVDFIAALASCQREAKSSFGDDRVLIEKYLSRPRHIEIQVFADTLGNAVYLFERDCSVQRRHQKILEEAPAPGMTPERRRAMGEAAVAAALAVNYVGAGTVEFIVEPSGNFFFMEMNTRLQVEHPVTEMITGHDLVEWQLRVASGEALPATQQQLQIHGHSIEARIYAENPDKGFLPSIGKLIHMRQPEHVAFQRSASGAAAHKVAAVRVDSGVRTGDSITPYYDPMIAKLIVWGEDRAQALTRMQQALSEFHIVGVANNVDFLERLISNSSFAQADLDTGLIERERAQLFPLLQTMPLETLAFACARVLIDEQAHQSADPWSHTQGWRLNSSYTRRIALRSGELSHDMELEYPRPGSGAAYVLRYDGLDTQLSLAKANADHVTLTLGDLRLSAGVIRNGDELHVFRGGRHHVLTRFDALEHAEDVETEVGGLSAPMSGKIIALGAAAGARVEKGALLMVMEAMKMEHSIVAPAAGMVEEILFAVGDQVAEGAPLVRFNAVSAS